VNKYDADCILLEITRISANEWRVKVVDADTSRSEVGSLAKLDGMLLKSRALRYEGDDMVMDFLGMLDDEFTDLGANFDSTIHPVYGAATYVVILTPAG
jgi:hypothetical protein